MTVNELVRRTLKRVVSGNPAIIAEYRAFHHRQSDESYRDWQGRIDARLQNEPAFEDWYFLEIVGTCPLSPSELETVLAQDDEDGINKPWNPEAFEHLRVKTG